MPYMQWSQDFELGLPEFDEHHQHLVNVLNLTYDGFIGGANSNEIEAILDELLDYAKFHFAAEENWMAAHAYPELSQHREEHSRFTRKIVEIKKDFHNGETDLSVEILQFLNDWLMDHILKTDADYGGFAKELLRTA